MPSPFPGMNPYLEQVDAWHSFHQWFCPRLAEQIVAKAGPRYMVKIDENVYLHELSSDDRRLFGRPDVMVVEPSPRLQTSVGVLAAPSPAPAYAKLPSVDLKKLSYIEIRDVRSRRLITAVELLSPTNKVSGSHRDQYVSKRATLMGQGVNFVEIDLLRGGQRMPMENVPACDYLVMVARPNEWPRAGIWPIRLRDPLPDIPIPLAEPDADAIVSLQAPLHAIYDAAGF